MSIWCLIKLLFLFIYISFCLLVTYLVYKEQKPYYTPLYVTKKSSKEGEKETTINLHDEFEEYRRKDEPVDFFSLFLGILLFGAIKLIFNIICTLTITYKTLAIINKKKLTKEDINNIRNHVKNITKFFLKYSGVIADYKRLPDEKILKVYKKYFGPDYKIDYDGKFSCYISNHTSMYDLLFAMASFGCGFVAKAAIRDTPIFGKTVSALQAIFVDRNNTDSKNNTMDQIIKRQQQFYAGEPVMPFMIYPEGTTTSGRDILRFKKGAFVSLLPVKASILQPNLSDKYHLSCGSSDVALNFMRSLSKLYVKAEYIELPIIAPNEYMYNNFSHFGKEKWEIFAEVSREIMCELGGFKKSERGIKDNFRYCSCLKKKTLLDSKEYKIE
jgi:1-acyl-sn-glycerol-3-phosphate acyltransferase